MIGVGTTIPHPIAPRAQDERQSSPAPTESFSNAAEDLGDQHEPVASLVENPSGTTLQNPDILEATQDENDEEGTLILQNSEVTLLFAVQLKEERRWLLDRSSNAVGTFVQSLFTSLTRVSDDASCRRKKVDPR